MSQLTSQAEQNCCHLWVHVLDVQDQWGICWWIIIYILYYTGFAKLRFLLFVAFTVSWGKEREEWPQRKILILRISFFECCSVIKGQTFPALQTAHTSGLLHQAVLLTLVIYWDSRDSARLFLCGFGREFESKVCKIKQEVGKLKSLMYHVGGPCALQGGFGVGRGSWALVALPALSPTCRWAHVASFIGDVTKDTSSRMAVEADMWNRWWGTGSTKKDSKPLNTHTYPRVLALAGKWERF